MKLSLWKDISTSQLFSDYLSPVPLAPPRAGDRFGSYFWSIEKGKGLNLVKARIDNKRYPPRNLISLTPKGRKLSVKIREMMEILGR